MSVSNVVGDPSSTRGDSRPLMVGISVLTPSPRPAANRSSCLTKSLTGNPLAQARALRSGIELTLDSLSILGDLRDRASWDATLRRGPAFTSTARGARDAHSTHPTRLHLIERIDYADSVCDFGPRARRRREIAGRRGDFRTLMVFVSN